MDPLGSLLLSQVIRNCEEQTANFLHKRLSDTKYCFELFRRALAERNSDALNAVYKIYHIMLEKWASQHSMLSLTNETAEYFGLEAFRSFQFAIRPEKLPNFTTLAQILRYLATCVDTSIKQHVRRYRLDELFQPDQDFGYTPEFDASMEFQRLWQLICEILEENEIDILLARCIYIYHMKPQEIVAKYSHIWPDTEAVRVNGQRIKRKLHADPRLRGWGLN